MKETCSRPDKSIWESRGRKRTQHRTGEGEGKKKMNLAPRQLRRKKCLDLLRGKEGNGSRAGKGKLNTGHNGRKGDKMTIGEGNKGN